MRRLLVPAVLILAAVVGDRGIWFPRPSPDLVLWGGRGFFLLAFLLAWRFRRGRSAFAICMVALLAEAWGTSRLESVFSLVVVVLALQLAVLPWLGEWWVGSLQGLLRFGFLAIEVGLFRALAGAAEASATWVWLAELEKVWWKNPWLESLRLPQAPLVALLCAGLLLALALVRRPEPLAAGLLGTLGACTLAFFSPPASAPLYLAAAGVILAVSQVESAFALAFEDGLTGLPGRRALEESLRNLGRSYAIAMVDIDHFKRLNDRYGHEIGDQVLRMVARELARVGGSGRAFRYGGEEFTLLFPRTSIGEARVYAEEMRRRIADRRFAVRGPTRPKRRPKGKSMARGSGTQIKVTVSIGVAERDPRRPAPEQVIKAADRALYRSKKGGRNRVTAA